MENLACTFAAARFGTLKQCLILSGKSLCSLTWGGKVSPQNTVKSKHHFKENEIKKVLFIFNTSYSRCFLSCL